jgi:hypothetical protein
VRTGGVSGVIQLTIQGETAREMKRTTTPLEQSNELVCAQERTVQIISGPPITTIDDYGRS